MKVQWQVTAHHFVGDAASYPETFVWRNGYPARHGRIDELAQPGQHRVNDRAFPHAQ
jgi:hypothetical protein